MKEQTMRHVLGQHPIAYFSAEFALNDSVPIYSGGLGVLAGDIIREVDDMDLPFVGVGLLYKEGYFTQRIENGEQVVEYPFLDTDDAPVRLLVDTDDKPITVSIPLQDTELLVQAWEYTQGEVSVYLLDTDVEGNSDEHRLITRRLYGGDKTTRILQEIVLGIGGVRMLMALGIHPSIFHLNESHSSFAIFEISYHYMREYDMSFKEAYEYGRSKIVFTNHTLVPAGNEVFDRGLVEEHLSSYAEQLGMPIEQVLEQGCSEEEGCEMDFSMTDMALELSCRINTVSKLHAVEAKRMWPNYDMPGITNGVHLPTWVNPDLKAQAPKCDPELLKELSLEDLWLIHGMAKHRLVDEVAYRTGVRLQKDHLIIGWARRMAAYKRPTAIFEDMARLKQLLHSETRPVQLLLAGKSHPSNAEGQAFIKEIHDIIEQHNLQNKVVFIPNYNMEVASFLVSGCDVWLNTPERGKEASGTSGMKAAANGVLQCSISDGWMDEVDISPIGWELEDSRLSGSLYDLLENSISCLFYERNHEGIPEQWLEKMKTAAVLAWTHFSSTRMVEEYIDQLYMPALELESKDKHHHHWRRNYRLR